MRSLLLLLCLPVAAWAQTTATARLPDNSAVLYDFLQAEAKKHFDARRKTVAGLKTADDVRQRQQQLHRAFLVALGPLPEKTPLKAKVLGSKHYDGYTLERVVYESRPDHHVTANFYLPEGKGPFPGVLLPCGHSVNGKAAEAYQRAAILMARNGLAVLSYDPIGQGERVQLLDNMGNPAIKGSTSEHTLTGVGALLVGGSTASYRIWDGIRSIDYLASRPEVDPHKIGCTGNSGGGTLTAYLMALDERIVAAAPSCYITSLERLFATIGPQDAEQNITGQVAFGMEHSDYVTMRAPRPTLILTGTQDFFDIQGSWTSFREAKLLYGMLGHGERVDLFEFNDKHGFSKPRREAAVRWMRRWLLNKDDAVTEGSFTVHKDAELQCTRTGQVLEDYKGKSVFDLNAERERELAGVRARFLEKAGRDGLLKEVRRLLAVPERVEPLRVEKTVVVPEEGVRVRFANRAVINDPPPKLKTLYLNGAEGSKEGYDVEIRGTGMNATKPADWDKGGALGRDVREAFVSLHLNRPLLGQRVLDVLCVVEAVHKQDGGKVHLVAGGSAAVVALHAAALDERIESVTLQKPLVSWSGVVRTPLSKGQLANVVPGVLAYYDLPDLARLIAPRKLIVEGAVDAAGNALSQEELERAWTPARAAYRGAVGNLVLKAAPRP